MIYDIVLYALAFIGLLVVLAALFVVVTFIANDGWIN